MSAGDASMNAELNGVFVGGVDPRVPWAVAFPRPEWNDPHHWAAARPAEVQ